MKNKRNILMIMFALVVIMGIGFAAYSQQLRINDTSSIDSNWNVYIKEVGVPSKTSGATGSGTVDEVEKLKAELTTDLKYPGDYVIYNITVANDGTIDAILEKINFNMDKEDTVINYYYSVDDEATWNKVTKNGENPYNEDLLANTTDEFQVKVEYDPTKTGTATNEQKSNKLTLNLDYVQKTGGGTVVPSGPIAAEILKDKVVTSGNGLYADEYEEGRYVYKGANPDNYITFNNETWRILSVENDGTLKIMKKDSIGNKKFDSQGLRDNSSNGTGGTYCAQCYYGCNAWAINDNFTNGSKSGTVLKDAELNTYLNSETDKNSYYNSLSDESKDLIATHNFSVGPFIYDSTTDLASQITSENGSVWNGKIGLMTVSEYIRANNNTSQCGSLSLNDKNKNTCKTTNYIALTSEYLWTISLHSTYAGKVFDIGNDGSVSFNDAYCSDGVLPVLYLSSNIYLKGEGTQSEPYIIN